MFLGVALQSLVGPEIGRGPEMDEYVFEVRLRAVVRVRAPDEEVARKVVSSLGSPGSIQIDLANQHRVAVGRAATVTEVDLMQENDPRLL